MSAHSNHLAHAHTAATGPDALGGMHGHAMKAGGA